MPPFLVLAGGEIEGAAGHTNNQQHHHQQQFYLLSTAFIMSFSIGTSTTVANMETSVPKMDMALGKYVGRRVRGVVVVCFFACHFYLWTVGRTGEEEKIEKLHSSITTRN